MQKFIYTLTFFFIVGATNQRLYTQNNTNDAQLIGSSNQHHVTIRSYTSKDLSNYLYEVRYYNSFGHNIQTVKPCFTPLGYDLAIKNEYDAFGRMTKQWLPASVEANNGAFVSELIYSNASASIYHNDSRPFNETIYETSFDERFKMQYGPGAAWTNLPVKQFYGSNDNSVAYFYINTLGYLLRGANYTPGTLSKTTVADEDGKTMTEFTDKLGRVIMKRSAGNVDTYFVHNDLGQLSYVLPPLASDGLKNYTIGATINLDNDYLKKYAYLYQYDNRGNQIYKRLPGCDPIYMVYDKANRLIFMQDGNLRQQSRWFFTIPDAFGRTVLSGTCTSVSNIGNYVIKAVPTFGYNNFYGYYVYYDNYVLPLQYYNVLITQADYYDNYSFFEFSPGFSALAYTTTMWGEFHTRYGDNSDMISSKGMLTGQITAIMGNPVSYNYSAYYYDYRARLIQTCQTNHLGGHDITYNAYNFSGNVTKTLKEHTATGQSLIRELYNYTYDHALRLLTTTYQLNNSMSVLLSSNQYDELGRLDSINRHNNLEKGSNKYNIRNWPTRIKRGLFTENLYYNTPHGGYLASTHCYNGNISHVECSDGANYNYYYDNLNRLIDAKSSNIPEDCNEMFRYDKNGNLTWVVRMGKNGQSSIDDLSFVYNGNQITKISDYSGSQSSYYTKEYQDLCNTTEEFLYDANGNMTADLDRNIVTIKYNLLNLPDTIQFKNGNQILHKYDAEGRKLSSTYVTSIVTLPVPLTAGATINTNNSNFRRYGTLYVGNIEYKLGTNGSINIMRIHNPEGFAGSTGTLYYYRKDHLGNNREVWTQTYGTYQTSQYYPSGLPWETNSGDNPDFQPYKYGGKEFVEAHGLDEYDSEARWCYPAIMRTTTMDPLAEKYYDISPYAWCGNNPVKFVDPDGREIKPTNGESLKMICNTLTTEDIEFVRYDGSGNIDSDFMNSHKSESGNYNALSELVNSDILTEVFIGNSYTFKNNDGIIQPPQKMSYQEADPKFADINGSTLNGTTTGEAGFMGQTLLPGKGSSGKNSPDNSIKIIINKDLSLAARSEMYSHEANGHALMYVRTGDRVKSGHIYSGSKDTNGPLINMIITSKKETIRNMQSR